MLFPRLLAPNKLIPVDKSYFRRWRHRHATGRYAFAPSVKLPVKIIVFRNDDLAFVELEMKAAGFVEFGTDLQNPDFAKLAEPPGCSDSARKDHKTFDRCRKSSEA